MNEKEICVTLKAHNDGWFVCDQLGYYYSTEEMTELGRALIETAEKCGDQIEDHNLNRDIELSIMWHEVRPNGVPDKSTTPPGCVYMLESDGKYKVGFSRNVERRIKQLATMPYPLKLFAVSKPICRAFQIEQKIHKRLENSRITGEWYSLSKEQAEKIGKYIESLPG